MRDNFYISSKRRSFELTAVQFVNERDLSISRDLEKERKKRRAGGWPRDKKQAVHSNLVCWRPARSLVAWVTFCWYIGAGQFNRSDSLNGVFPWECKPRVHLGPAMPTGVSPLRGHISVGETKAEARSWINNRSSTTFLVFFLLLRPTFALALSA